MKSKLFDLFGVPVYAFGAAICLAFMFAFWLTRYLIRKDKRDPMYPPDAPQEQKDRILEYVYDLGFGAMVGAVAGARLFHVFAPSNIRQYIEAPLTIFYIWQGGLVFYGGLIGAFTVCFAMVVRKKIPPWHLGEFTAPSIAFGYGIGRWGCFMNGCCYGQACSWGIVYPELRDGIPRHPTQIYESMASFAIGMFLLWLLPRRTHRGQVFFTFILLYAIERFLVEFWRDDPRGGLGPMTTSQWIAIFTVPAAIAMLVFLRRTQPIPVAPKVVPAS